MQSGNFWKTALIFFVIVAVILGLFALWNVYFGSDRIDIEETAKNFEKLEQDIKAALKADTYGGKTPQETLDLFIEALRKEDVELAAKYFMLDLNFTPENQEYFLTRKKWEEELAGEEVAGRLQKLADVLISAKQLKDQKTVSEDTIWFEVLDKNNAEAYQLIAFKFNKESGVWKIESM